MKTAGPNKGPAVKFFRFDYLSYPRKAKPARPDTFAFPLYGVVMGNGVAFTVAELPPALVAHTRK
jgi:hypothetical protein